MFNVRFVVEQRNKKKCKKPSVIHALGNIKWGFTHSADDLKVKDPPLVKDQGGRGPIHALHTLACLLSSRRGREVMRVFETFSRDC